MGSTQVKHNLTFEELCEIVAPIAEKRGVERVYLFGSRARGDNGEKSDYDFYIIPGRIRSLIGLSGLLQDLKEALGEDVDIVSENPRINDDFLQEALRDRRLVYEA
ncbi:MAG: nucleotidyltransferase domain-containing protein [Methanomassiliicoccaceae archaeon]|nr:nucleotidyltransferase domain-containing protein [Methanomassiliicoccaceae archaeon]